MARKISHVSVRSTARRSGKGIRVTTTTNVNGHIKTTTKTYR